MENCNTLQSNIPDSDPGTITYLYYFIVHLNLINRAINGYPAKMVKSLAKTNMVLESSWQASTNTWKLKPCNHIRVHICIIN